MQQRPDQNEKAGGPLGIRTSVWFTIFGFLLLCMLAISVSRRNTRPRTAQTASADQAVARQDLSPAPRTSVQSVYRVSPPETVFAGGTQSTSYGTSAPAISNELRIANAKLTQLRDTYSDEHPEVRGQIRAIESLERSAATPGETLELAVARAELARLQVNLGDGHPELQKQLRAIESLERSAAANEPSDLAEAKAQLARLRVGYADAHPEVRGQIQAIESLERSTAAKEPSDLAEAKAQLARLRVNYADTHPEVQSQLRKIAALER